MTITKMLNPKDKKRKTLIVKMEIKVDYSSKTGSPKCDFFSFLKTAPLSYSYVENNIEKQAIIDSYFIKGVKGKLRYHSNQLKDYSNKNQVIDTIFGIPDQESLIAFTIPSVIFSPHDDPQSEDDWVQIYHSTNKKLFFDIDVSQLDFEQTSFLTASILRFHRTPIKRGSEKRRIGELTLSLVDRTITSGSLPQDEASFKVKRIIDDEPCVEEFKPIVKRAKEILRGE